MTSGLPFRATHPSARFSRHTHPLGPAMKWTDTRDIAVALSEAHPDVDPNSIRFTDLHQWVRALSGFDDDPKRGGEKVLEAIQSAWIDEIA